MNYRNVLFVISFLAMAFPIGLVTAGDALTQTEVENLIKGNTAEGIHTKWDRKMIWYFHESGQLRKLNDAGKRGNADWKIDKNGQLCFQDKHMNDEKCEPVIPRTDGGYDANDGKWRWEKIIQGNPHNL